ncbi:metal ABC transporter permease [Bartonella tamiae]|uniref:Uncharacterized protein n=1 Tax=Bartonella tamiae Th239 TaxID=1094558 RepID=J0R654_9HYPH|nr:metal ABC transporter permease [Bartonella tamiae]EJF91184.1 hypothetical protein ME5_00516 [Bartonella tamiae Th239]EJF93151.1 hypothetical protein MEG_01365 [Bartonella tamiae Th307]
MIDTLLFPFQYPFMIRGMVITMTVAFPMAMLSCFLILKGWSLLGDAISHAVFPGVVIGYMVTPSVVSGLALLPWAAFHMLNPSDVTMAMMAIGAFIAGMICAILTGFIGANSRVKQDTVMGVVFSSMFGLGLVLATSIESELHLNHILFGHLLGVNWLDITQTAIISIIIVAILGLKWRDFLLFSFDFIQARAVGLSVKILHYALLMMISLTIVAALKAVGIILAISLLIAPGAIAYLMTKRFSTMLIIAILIGVSCSFLGVYLSIFIGSDAASTVVLLMTILFVMTFIGVSYSARRVSQNSL